MHKTVQFNNTTNLFNRRVPLKALFATALIKAERLNATSPLLDISFIVDSFLPPVCGSF